MIKGHCTTAKDCRATEGSYMLDYLAPGDWVRHPTQESWGAGQVQSVIGDRVTVNFEHAGKRLINTAVIPLVKSDPPTFRRPQA